MKKVFVLFVFVFVLTVSCNLHPNNANPNSHASFSKDERIAYLEEKNRELEAEHQRFFEYFMWLFATILGGSVVLVYLNVRESRRKDKIIYNSEQFLQHSIYVQESERKRISQELHDSVAQSLRYVSLLAENLSDKDAARKIIASQNESIENIRMLCYNLTPPSINMNNFISSLSALGQKIFETANTEFQFRVVCEPSVTFENWSDDNLMNLYRIIQEALQNIQKHAEASETTVFFRKEADNKIKIIITDDGKGMSESFVAMINSGDFEKVETMHFGVRNIFERARLLGGKVTYFSEEDFGTRLTVEI